MPTNVASRREAEVPSDLPAALPLFSVQDMASPRGLFCASFAIFASPATALSLVTHAGLNASSIASSAMLVSGVSAASEMCVTARGEGVVALEPCLGAIAAGDGSPLAFLPSGPDADD